MSTPGSTFFSGARQKIYRGCPYKETLHQIWAQGAHIKKIIAKSTNTSNLGISFLCLICILSLLSDHFVFL